MHAGEPYSGGADLAGARGTASKLRQPLRRAGQEVPPRTRWLPAVAGIGGGIALFAYFLRISLSHGMNSDGANNALQGWDMLHGNLLLHGWIIGDATYYTLELPLYVITEALLGLHILTYHVVSALTYLIVVACAAALAMADSRGLSRAARCVSRDRGAGIAAAYPSRRVAPARSARPHWDRRDHAGLVPADRPGPRLAFHAAAALRDPVRRPDRRRHRPLRRRAGDPAGVRLSRPGRPEDPDSRHGDPAGRRRLCPADVPDPRGDEALGRVRDGRAADQDLAHGGMATSRGAQPGGYPQPVRGHLGPFGPSWAASEPPSD